MSSPLHETRRLPHKERVRLPPRGVGNTGAVTWRHKQQEWPFMGERVWIRGKGGARRRGPRGERGQPERSSRLARGGRPKQKHGQGGWQAFCVHCLERLWPRIDPMFQVMDPENWSPPSPLLSSLRRCYPAPRACICSLCFYSVFFLLCLIWVLGTMD